MYIAMVFASPGFHDRFFFSERTMSTQNPQYMVKKLVPHWKFFKQTSPEKYGSGPVGMLKNLWGEVTIRIMSSLGC